MRDAQVTLAAVRVTDARGIVVATTGTDLGQSLASWQEVAAVLAGAPIVTTMRRREPAAATPNGISRTSRLRVLVALPIAGAHGVVGAVIVSRTPRDLEQAIGGNWRELTALVVGLAGVGVLLALVLSRLVIEPLRAVVGPAPPCRQGWPRAAVAEAILVLS